MNHVVLLFYRSSHILSEVERLCDRVAIIRGAQIIEVGILTELQHLTRMMLHVETKKLMPILKEIRGAHEIEELDKGTKYVSQSGFGLYALRVESVDLEGSLL